MIKIFGVPAIPRSKWAQISIPTNRSPITYGYMAVHHGASGNTSAWKNPVQTLKNYLAFHKNTKGWWWLFYCAALDKQGNLYQGRFPFSSHNSSLGWGQEFNVVLLGNNEEEDLTDAQEEILTALWQGMSKEQGKKVRLTYHSERASAEGRFHSTCPGKYAKTFLNELRELDPFTLTPDVPETFSVPSVLGQGDKGTEIEELQTLLNDVFNSGLTVDGDFGNGTRIAVEKAQSLMNVTVDGLWGSQSSEAVAGYVEATEAAKAAKEAAEAEVAAHPVEEEDVDITTEENGYSMSDHHFYDFRVGAARRIYKTIHGKELWDADVIAVLTEELDTVGVKRAFRKASKKASQL